MAVPIFIRGGGDLASGVAYRLAKVGLYPFILELPEPLVVRRWVAFAEAIYSQEITIEGVMGRRAQGLDEALSFVRQGVIPVMVDPLMTSLKEFCQAPARFDGFLAGTSILIDGRMTKQRPDLDRQTAALVIGLGPGFCAGDNCHAVIETNRGHCLGRVIWDGPAQEDTRQPEAVGEYGAQRVLRAPAAGVLQAQAAIGDHLEPGQPIASVAGQSVLAPFAGVLRGLLHPGSYVEVGLKIGDLDPRDDPANCRLISDKSLAIGGGVLEAILSQARLRPHLWD